MQTSIKNSGQSSSSAPVRTSESSSAFGQAVGDLLERLIFERLRSRVYSFRRKRNAFEIREDFNGTGSHQYPAACCYICGSYNGLVLTENDLFRCRWH